MAQIEVQRKRLKACNSAVITFYRFLSFVLNASTFFSLYIIGLF
jgi:hypothetical protein